MAILIVFSRVRRLALVVWLGIHALAWGLIFAMIELFETIRKSSNALRLSARERLRKRHFHKQGVA
jgi:hypothetical protein